MGFDGWFFKGGSTQNRWLLMGFCNVFFLHLKIKRPGRLQRSTRSASPYLRNQNTFCSGTILKLNKRQNFCNRFLNGWCYFKMVIVGLIHAVCWCGCLLQSRWISKICCSWYFWITQCKVRCFSFKLNVQQFLLYCLAVFGHFSPPPPRKNRSCGTNPISQSNQS